MGMLVKWVSLGKYKWDTTWEDMSLFVTHLALKWTRHLRLPQGWLSNQDVWLLDDTKITELWKRWRCLFGPTMTKYIMQSFTFLSVGYRDIISCFHCLVPWLTSGAADAFLYRELRRLVCAHFHHSLWFCMDIKALSRPLLKDKTWP